jgi:DNA-binding CsgD family transcriptional regulator
MVERVQDAAHAMAQPVSSPETQNPSLLVSIIFRIFGAMTCGLILVDSYKRVSRLNERARSCLGDGLSTKTGRLCATDRSSDLLFQVVMDQCLKYGERHRNWRREAVALSREQGRTLIARVVPVEGDARELLEGAALVVILVDPDECPEPSSGLLQQVFGLTKGEARIASRIVCGETLQQIAGSSGVSVGTVRTQAKALFTKTGTHRQAELVRLLTRLAMISEDDRQDP